MTGFRWATLQDADLLYKWRHQDQHQPWYQGPNLDPDQHQEWLRLRLKNPLVRILIWEEHNQPAGMVRRDSNNELSFHATTNNTALQMLTEAITQARETGASLKATVDQDDPKAGLLEQAGFTVYPATFLAYKP